MPESEYKILSEETVQEPETLVAVLDDLLMAHKSLSRAVALNTVLLLHHLGEFSEPPEGDYEDTVAVLKSFLRIVHETTVNDKMLDALLNSKE